MTSNIDPGKPTAGLATTASVRDNFATAKSEIEALQAGKQDADADLTAVAALGPSAGLLTRTGPAAFAMRTLTGPAAGLAIDNGDGAGGNPTLTLANDLAALEGMAGVGLVVRTATDTYAQRAITGPATGLAVVNGDGAAGNPTVGLANDLAAIEALATTGGVERTGADAWATYALTAAGKALLDDADAAAQRATLGLGTAAVKSTGTSGNNVPLLDGANTWSGVQIVKVDAESNPFRLEYHDDADLEGPGIFLDRISASPATNDRGGIVVYRFRNSAAANFSGVKWGSKLKTATAGTESCEAFIETRQAGASNQRFIVGNGLYTPNAAGGDKGLDTINAGAVYDDNVLLTCYVLEAATHGTIDAAKWDATIDGRPFADADGDDRGAASEQPAARDRSVHEPARRFAAERFGLLDPERYGDVWRAAGHLPSMPSPNEWHSRGNKIPIGEVLQRLWEAVELQAVHIDRLNQQIKTMRAPS